MDKHDAEIELISAILFVHLAPDFEQTVPQEPSGDQLEEPNGVLEDCREGLDGVVEPSSVSNRDGVSKVVADAL